MVERIKRVEQWREIQLWRRLLPFWRDHRVVGIAGELEQTIIDRLVAICDLLRSPVAKRLEVLDVTLHRFGEIGECERKNVSVRQAQNGGTSDLRERAS